MVCLLLDTTLPFVGVVSLSGLSFTLFCACILGVLGFEVINGFHDTANAVATVIYTNTLRPTAAIIWSGFWNFTGVFVIGTAVAMSLLKLVPLDAFIRLPLHVGASLVLAVLTASIIWNLSTWYVGLPLSSSHTLIGALIGASLGFSQYYGGSVNWNQAGEIGLSLLLSPIIGFVGSLLLLYGEKKVLKNSLLFRAPAHEHEHPPLPIRLLLITTCTLVSFFHGSNDGQKGVGLLMLVLITFLPARFALNPDTTPAQLRTLLLTTEKLLQQTRQSTPAQATRLRQAERATSQLRQQVQKHQGVQTREQYALRREFQHLTSQLKAIADESNTALPADVRARLNEQIRQLDKTTDFAPIWVLVAISLSLGLGTMIGWRRIVTTIGERIGNEHLTYAEGATAELVAASTIGLSTLAGLPVSTTHVLSSGVAGAMVASGGTKNLNYGTLRNIAVAWLLTVPAAIGLAYALFLGFHRWL